MPLTTSPIDGQPMRVIHRYGIEFDVCPSTGGVWLDKGELEKLIALIKDETLHEKGDDRRHGRYRDNDDDDYDRDRHRGRKRSRLADLFDF
jgi:Zn-finger nucleic acid-binding protein